jgi:hypothetical protein
MTRVVDATVLCAGTNEHTLKSGELIVQVMIAHSFKLIVQMMIAHSFKMIVQMMIAHSFELMVQVMVAIPFELTTGSDQKDDVDIFRHRASSITTWLVDTYTHVRSTSCIEYPAESWVSQHVRLSSTNSAGHVPKVHLT